MKALHVAKYGRFPQLIQLPIPKLQNDQFLIKMKYAPINPSDINFFQGFYGIKKSGTPIVGFEGSGVIVESGNPNDHKLIGRSVSVLANKDNGTFATHITSNSEQFILWPDQMQFIQESLKQLSMSWINPVSCIGLTNYIAEHNFQTVVISAATSQLSKMMIRYIKKKYPNTKVIGFSRSQTHDQELLKIGLTEINRINDTQRIQKLKNTQNKILFLDCIGGQFASKMFNSLPRDSMMVSYGRLSKQPLNNIDLGELYFGNKKIEGFWMNTFLKQITKAQLIEIKKEVIENHKEIFYQNIRKEYPLQNYMEAIRQSIKNASQGKILLTL